MTLAIQTAIVMVVLLVIMLAMGVSISISVGLSSAVAMLCMLPAQVSFVTSAQRLFAGANSFSLIAIPFFILAGNLMNNGGIAERLVNVAKAIAGRMPGALAQTNIIANMLFGAISGSGAAAAAKGHGRFFTIYFFNLNGLGYHIPIGIRQRNGIASIFCDIQIG